MRWILLSAGVVAVLVAAVGLLTPVSVDPARQVVACGTAVSPDLSAARAIDDGSAANVPALGDVVVDRNCTELCRMELEDRRLWTITLLGVGLLAAGAGAVWHVRSRRSARARTASQGTG